MQVGNGLVPEDYMSLCCGSRNGRMIWLGFFLTLSLAFCSTAALAQPENPPKADVFAGYQWLNPGGSIPDGTSASGNVLPFKLPSMPAGFGLAFGYNFHPNFALEGDFGANYKDGNDVSTYSIGPRYTYRGEGINLFAHTLLGANHLNTASFGARTGIGAILGGGIDLSLTRHLSLRLIEADYQWAKENFARQVPPSQPDLRRPSYSGARLRTGIVLNFGGAPTVPPAATCTVDHAEVMQGEPITATAELCLERKRWHGHGQGQHGLDRYQGRCRWQLHGHGACDRSQGEEERRRDLYCELHREGATQESTDDDLLGKSDDRANRHSGHDHMQLHEPGWCTGDGIGMDGQRGQRFRQWERRNPEHHRRIARTGYGQRNLYRRARSDSEFVVAGDDRESAAPASEGQQVEPVRFPEREEALARG